MKFRLLTAEELNAVDPQGVTWPIDTFAIAAFDGGEIVGRLVLRNLPVLEGWWVRPDQRGTVLAEELVERSEQMLKGFGRTHAMCMSYDEAPQIRRFIKEHGYDDFPVRFHVKELQSKAA